MKEYTNFKDMMLDYKKQPEASFRAMISNIPDKVLLMKKVCRFFNTSLILREEDRYLYTEYFKYKTKNIRIVIFTKDTYENQLWIQH
jgi:hypothetical protein